MTRVALYLRVSTAEQDVAMQRTELTEFCEKRGWTIVGVYQDIGVSGKKDSRPELNRLMADAHKRRFDCVAVWKFDRFARSVSHLLRALETFQSLKVDFVSFSESIDTSTPYGKLVFSVLAAVAELERCLIAERVKAGMKAAKAKGQKFGRPRADVDAKAVAELRLQGVPFSAIGRQLGIAKSTAVKLSQQQAG
jgi:DNA invertase Pin-like site-specific DNA recombinase